MLMRHSMLWGLALTLIAACRQPAPPPPPAAAVRTAIEQRLTEIVAILKNRDAAAAAAVFTPDAVWILPDGTTFTGTAAITEGYTRFFGPLESFEPELVAVDRLYVIDDHQVDTFAHAVATLQVKGKKTGERHINHFADHWQLGSDGVWRIAYEVNADGRVPER